MEPSWEKAARILKGAVKVGAVNVDVEKSLGSQYGIQGFPTLKFFGFNKKKDPEDYQGARDADGIVNFASQKLSAGLKNRMKGKDSSSGGAGGSQQSSGGNAGGGGSSSGGGASGDEVIVLTESNFDSLVMRSKDIWIVEFYAPWCGHCQALEPEYAQAAKNLKGQVKLGKVDATVEQSLGQRFGVRGYPTVKVFDYGMAKSDATAKDYPGERTAAAITSYGAGLAEKADIEPDLFELIKQNVYADNCQGPIICVISFLPNIYDSNAKERNGYLNVIKKVAKQNRKHPFKWFWLSAGDQLDLERDLNLGFGFPALVAVSPQKKMIATMRGSYSQDNIGQFLSDLMIGKGGLSKLAKDFKVKKAEKWDGKDAPPLEEIDLEDL